MHEVKSETEKSNNTAGKNIFLLVENIDWNFESDFLKKLMP